MEDEESKEGKEVKECLHISNKNDWLPLLTGDTELTLSPHPYCDKCGLVRNIGPDRPRKLGFYVDKLSELEKHLEEEDAKGGKAKLTEAQKRLIVKKMENEKVFNDLYGVLASTQEDKFVEIVKEFRPDLEENLIKYYLD